MSDTRTIRDVLTEQVGYGTVPDGPSLIKRLADKYATTLGLDPDTVLERMCETCEGAGRIKGPSFGPMTRGFTLPPCPDCDGSGWVTVNRIMVGPPDATIIGPDDERALRIGLAVLACELVGVTVQMQQGTEFIREAEVLLRRLLAAGDDDG